MAYRPQSIEKPRVVIATHNQHKFAELTASLHQVPFEFLPLTDWNLEPAGESGTTFVENALLKARHACHFTGLPAIADDSGLVVDLLDGEPGIHSSRYASDNASDVENNTLLLERIKAKRMQNEPVIASFVAVLVYMDHKSDPSPKISEGCWRGSIVDEPRGDHGFGYDPLFLPTNATFTAAELGPSIKYRESHRAKAARKLIPMLLDLAVDPSDEQSVPLEPSMSKIASLRLHKRLSSN